MATTALTQRRAFRRPLAYRPPMQRAPHLRLHLRNPVSETVDIPNTFDPGTADFDAQPFQDTMPLDTASVACLYLEQTAESRRCLAAESEPLASLDQQVRHCLTADHQQCRNYRRQVGANPVPRRHLAIYTTLAILLLALVAFASYQALSGFSVEAQVTQELSVE